MPRWLRRLVEALAPRDRRDDLVGDLEEMHRRRLSRLPAAAAHLGTLLDAAGTVGHLAWRRTVRATERVALTGVELRLALRLLRRSPLVVVTVVLALTAGVTLATAGFTVLRGVLDVRLPFPEGERVVELRFRDARTAEPRTPPHGLVTALRDGSASLEQWGAASVGTGNLRLPSQEVTLVAVVALTPGAFGYALPRPLVGGGLPTTAPAEGEPRPAVLSASLWQRRFGGEPTALGQVVEVSGVPHRIAGVFPDEAGFPARADLWTLLPPGGTPTDPTSLFGLLRPGTALAAAEAELGALARAVAQARGEPPVDLRLIRVEDPPASGSQGVLVVGFLVAFLLVIAGNVGNLMVARAASRTEELAVRSALGADRARLVLQLALEALLLVGVSSAAGLWIAGRLLAWFRVSDADQLPPWIDLVPGAWTVGFVVGVAGLLTVVAGIVPALRATSPAGSGRSHGGRSPTRPGFGWGHSAMITAQIAFSVGILGGAALVQRAWVGSLSLEALPDADAIATAHLSRSAAPEDRGGPPAATAGAGTAGPAGLSEVAAAVRAAHPGSRVALSDHLPGVDAPRGAVEVEGQATPITVPVARVEPEFFGVVGAEALSGRLPDAPSSPAAGDGAAVVDLPFVERHLGSANAVGRRIRPASRGAEEGRWYEIVAVVPDLGLSGLDASAAGGLYLPFVEGPTARLLIRTPGDPRVVGATLPQIVYGVDPAIAVSRIHVLGAVVRGVRAVFQGLGAVFTGLGVLVLVLALMGVYAILAFEVSRRRREFGIRVALGASAPTLVRPLALRVGAYVAVGSGVGWLLGSVVVSTARAMIQLRTAPSGGAVFALLALVVLATAAAAAAAPTLRVLRIPPAEALQAD